MILFDGIIDNWYYGNGISRYYRTIASGAFRRGYDVKVFGFSQKFQPLDDVDNISLVKPRFLERYRDFDVEISDAQVFHSSYYRLPLNKKMTTVKKIVTTVHDFVYERFARGPKKYIHSWQKKKAILGSDVVICISESTRQDLYRFIPEFQKSKACVVYNGVSSNFFPVSGEAIDLPLPYVLFVGGRAGYKNFDLAVNSVSQINGLCLVIVGGGDISPKEKILLETLIPGRYKVVGRINDDLLRKYYSNAHALLYPSSFEGFGIPIIEAMRCGCPVLALKSPAIEEVGGKAIVIVDEINSNLFANKLINFYNIGYRSDLRECGLEWSEKFSWDSCINNTIEKYL